MSRNMMNAYRLGRTIDFLLELNNAILTLDDDGGLCVEDTDGIRCSLQPLSVDSSVTDDRAVSDGAT